MKNIIIIFLITICNSCIAQELYSKLIPIYDSTIAQFAEINSLYYLKEEKNKSLKKLVNQIITAKTPQEARKALFKIANTPNEINNPTATFDYYFKNTNPAPGTNVEKFVNIIKANKDVYYLVNKKNNFNVDTTLSIDSFVSKVQQKIGWQYGYGAFAVTTTYDSIYIATMKKYDVSDIDNQIIEIIERHLQYQTPIYKYPADDILKEVLQVNGVKDAIWDHCVTKTLQLPNWDNLGVIIIKGKDTVERVYNLQISGNRNIKIGKRFLIPIKTSDDVWFRKTMYGLHWVRHTREQCLINNTRR